MILSGLALVAYDLGAHLDGAANALQLLWGDSPGYLISNGFGWIGVRGALPKGAPTWV